MEQTAIEKVINDLMNEAVVNDVDDRYKMILSHVVAKLESLLPYEKERERKISILFLEWYYDNIIRMNLSYVLMHYTGNEKSFETLSALYDYWCEKIMNTQQKEIEKPS